jgi:uncharacterized protein YndB with AHSA1/START domain
MLKWVLALVGSLIALVVLPLILGMFLPKQHVAISSVTLRQPPDSLWIVMFNLADYPAWWPDVRSMERRQDDAGGEIWVQTDTQGRELPLEMVKSDPPARLVMQIADERLPFRGSWTYLIEPAAFGSMVTVTEEGEIFNPVFRLVARVFLGYHGTIDRYLQALGSRFGEDVTPAHLN